MGLFDQLVELTLLDELLTLLVDLFNVICVGLQRLHHRIVLLLKIINLVATECLELSEFARRYARLLDPVVY